MAFANEHTNAALARAQRRAIKRAKRAADAHAAKPKAEEKRRRRLERNKLLVARDEGDPRTPGFGVGS